MIIVIDAILSNAKPRGVSRYTMQLILGLEKIDTKNTYYIFYGSWMKEYEAMQMKNPNFHMIKKEIPSDTISRNLYKSMVLPIIAKRLHADVFHVTDTSPIFYKTGKVVSTIHDLAEFVVPEKYSRIAVFCRKKYLWFQTKLSDRIITVSQYSKEQIERRFPCTRGKITVTYNGVDQERFIFQQGEANKRPPYFLYIGGMEKSKNVPIIIEAFAKLPKKIQREYEVWLVGSPNSDTPIILEKIKENALELQVKVIDYVNEDELPSLYQQAFAFIHPSQYEGFGIPLVEAFAAQIPVIASTATCFPEICQDAALFFDPTKVDECRDCMLQLIQSKELRDQLIEKGNERRMHFQWEQLCKDTLRVYEN